MRTAERPDYIRNMKKLFNFCLIGVSVALISWGFKGHRAVATIAQKHLTSNTAYVVSAYLKGEGNGRCGYLGG
jgi:hypothetical protein